MQKRLKVDNVKAAITRNRHFELEYNLDFLAFANHYGTIVVPCTPYSPQEKGKVEAAVKSLKQNFVSDREFTDSSDLKRKLNNWMNSYANMRVHGATRRVPWQELLDTERKALLLLPEGEFNIFQRSVRRVGLNGHIRFDKAYSTKRQKIKWIEQASPRVEQRRAPTSIMGALDRCCDYGGWHRERLK